MRTTKAQAPDILELLLKMDKNTFTVSDVAEELQITKRQARAAIVYGLSEEKLRVALTTHSSERDLSLYENVAWRRKWVVSKWE